MLNCFDEFVLFEKFLITIFKDFNLFWNQPKFIEKGYNLTLRQQTLVIVKNFFFFSDIEKIETRPFSPKQALTVQIGVF